MIGTVCPRRPWTVIRDLVGSACPPVRCGFDPKPGPTRRIMAGQPGLCDGYLLVSVLTVGLDDAGLFQPGDNRSVRQIRSLAGAPGRE
jgi:hypothetical protein